MHGGDSSAGFAGATSWGEVRKGAVEAPSEESLRRRWAFFNSLLGRRSWLGRGSARPPIPLRGYVLIPTGGQRLRAGALRPALRRARRHGSP